MDNECFELCKEVYKRTGWKTSDYMKGYPIKYTSDYLLEKLPATVKNDFDGGNDYIILYKKEKSWYADYMGQFKRQKSDTPLKALLKLTLKLHEEKIL